MSSDYKKKYTDLVSYIPTAYHNSANTSFLRNLHDKFLTKEESAPLLGYVGNKIPNDSSTYISAPTLDREINSLVPAVYTKLGAEEHVFTFNDVLQKLKLLGVDTNGFATWGKATGFNLVPPIDLDKFSNYSRYRWYGHLIAAKKAYNANGSPEYYVIDTAGESDWATDNYWVHEDDVAGLFASSTFLSSFSINDTLQGVRPIIEYPSSLENEMVLHIVDGKPMSSGGTTIIQTKSGYKTSFNQKPLFNLYLHDGSHSGFISSIFYYSEGNAFPIDAALKTRVQLGPYGDYVFEQGLISKDLKRILFYKDNGVLSTIWKKGQEESPVYVIKTSDGSIVEIDPSTDLNGAGTWKYPNQMFHNITHENRKQIGFGDLLGHFTDIIKAQTAFEGNPYGSNNYRNIIHDFGLGGKIKDYNTNFGLFLGLVNQLDSSVPSIIEFGKQQYAQLLGSIGEYVAKNIGEAITNNIVVSPLAGLTNANDPSIDPLFKSFLAYVATRNDSSVFSDTTSGVTGWPATIPYFGLTVPTTPLIQFDTILGTNVIKHHDGHLTIIKQYDSAFEKRIASEIFVRSNGVSSPGTVSFTAPVTPFKNQFWFDLNTNTLKTFAVTSDTTELYPANTGDLFFNRSLRQLFKFDGASSMYTLQPDFSIAWEVVNISTIIAHLTLAVETRLFDECPTVVARFDIDSYPNQMAATALMSKEFAIYANINGLDISSGDYLPTDAFTWNYSNAIIPGITRAPRWFTMYKSYFGTSRPNVEPWVLVGHSDKPSTWDAKYADTTGTRTWSTKMWSDIKNIWGKKLAVDTLTDSLLPPYVSVNDPLSSEALLTTIPLGIQNGYAFGDLGPAEMLYRTSIDFAYDKLKISFKLDPVNFINSTWGYNTIKIGDYEIDRHEHSKLSHHDFILHGETPLEKFNGYDLVGLVCASTPDSTWVINCYANSVNGSIFTITGDQTGILSRSVIPNIAFVDSKIRFSILDNGTDFNIGDKFVIDVATLSVQFIPSLYSKFDGLNQWFVNLNRYNSVDMSVALANNILREWDMKLGYRMGGLVNTELLKMESDISVLHDSDFSVIIKENKNTASYWLNSIRIQLIRVGTTINVGGINIPANKGADWVFRLETFNKFNPEIEYYKYDSNGKFQTFSAFEKLHTADAWKHLKDRTVLVKKSTPFVITGIENVANVIFGYIDRLSENGWIFNNADSPEIDSLTGRAINWQMFIERFIDQQYSGTHAGAGSILNPFADAVWFSTPRGVVSNMRDINSADSLSTQSLFDSFGSTIHSKDIQIFRNDDVTEIRSNVVIGGIHLLVDEYEHIVLFEGYIYDKSRKKLIYDPFLGVRVNRLHLAGERQAEFNGRLSFGGHYIKNNTVQRNIEASVSDILNYYDADNMIDNSQTARHARGLLGYEAKQYMSDLDLSDKSQFGFWRGLISNKGSNLSVNAFLNSSRFESAKIDEFWAYKLAEYGDARQLSFPEIKLSTSDAIHNFTKINFTSTTNPDQLGFINISKMDEARWVSLDEVSNEVSFESEKICELVFDDTIFDTVIYDLSLNGKAVICDSVMVYIEVIASMYGGDPTPFLLPQNNFVLVNSSTIQFTSAVVIDPSKYTVNYVNGHNNPKFVVHCFGPSQPKFNPAKLIDYKNKVIISDLSLWDPARGSHSIEALQVVDMISPNEPAKYNHSINTVDNVNYDPYRPWDNKDVGRVWWNTNNLNYVPYSDVAIFPSLDSRLSYWGALSDWSTIELYEWTESTVHPSQYDVLVKAQEGDSTIQVDSRASGTVAINELYTRTRTWNQRPIAWGYSDSPGTITPALVSVGESRVTLSFDAGGSSIAVLSSNNWLTAFTGISIGMKISGADFHYNVDDVTDLNNFKLLKPFGEAIVTGLNQDLIVGSSTSIDTGVFNPPVYTIDG
jgi:hypothetical protein